MDDIYSTQMNCLQTNVKNKLDGQIHKYGGVDDSGKMHALINKRGKHSNLIHFAPRRDP